MYSARCYLMLSGFMSATFTARLMAVCDPGGEKHLHTQKVRSALHCGSSCALDNPYIDCIQSDHRAQCVSNVALCSYVALCGPCCYFEETPVRLTTGCHSVILCPLSGLCDCSPADGERSRLHSLLWISIVWMDLEMYSTCQLQSSPVDLHLYILYIWTSSY